MPFTILPATNEISGFGRDIHKIVDNATNESLGYIGTIDDKKSVFFPKPIQLQQLTELVGELFGCY